MLLLEQLYLVCNILVLVRRFCHEVAQYQLPDLLHLLGRSCVRMQVRKVRISYLYIITQSGTCCSHSFSNLCLSLFFSIETKLSPPTSDLVQGSAPGKHCQTSENKKERSAPQWRLSRETNQVSRTFTTISPRLGPMARKTIATDSKRVCFEALPQATVAHLSTERATTFSMHFLVHFVTLVQVKHVATQTVQASRSHVRTGRCRRHLSD